MKKKFPFSKADISRMDTCFRNVGITYPRKILTRRLGLLTQQEARKVKRGLEKLYLLEEECWEAFYDKNFLLIEKEIDGVIANRAEIEKDSWR